jgi:type IX secretion system substrate protein
MNTKIIKRITMFVGCCTLIVFQSYSQGISNLFMGGYDNGIMTLPWGGNKINFISGQATVGQVFRVIDFKWTGTNITDSVGDLIFATNGVILIDNKNDTMVNGYGLNPSPYTTSFNTGLRLWQGNVILPHPDTSYLYYLFHSTIDVSGSNPYSRYFYYSKIDMSLNNGHGSVVLKNKTLMNAVPIFDDTLSFVGITACKHGNGRDWWVLTKDVIGSNFHFILLTNTGPLYHHSQQIGTRVGTNQYCFSPDGTKLGSYGTDDDFEIFDFDRCSGLLSNYRKIIINDSIQIGLGAAFSPNSQYLYGSSSIYLYQIDATSNQPNTTLKTVATWDGTYSPNPPFAATFFVQQLANNGKIYITSANGTLMMHTIESPNFADTLCDVQQHSVSLPTYNSGTIPNFPNYNLGPLIGSPCDTLVGIYEIFNKPINLTISPNPSAGQLEVNYELPQNERGVLEIINILGEVVYKHDLVQWSSVHRLNLDVSSGIYQVMVTTSKTRESKKILIQ